MNSKSIMIFIFALIFSAAGTAKAGDLLRDYGCKAYELKAPKSISQNVNNVFVETMAFGVATFSDQQFTLKGTKRGTCEFILALEKTTDSDSSDLLCTEIVKLCGKSGEVQDPRAMFGGGLSGLAPEEKPQAPGQRSYLDHKATPEKERPDDELPKQEGSFWSEPGNKKPATEVKRQPPLRINENEGGFYYRDLGK